MNFYAGSTIDMGNEDTIPTIYFSGLKENFFTEYDKRQRLKSAAQYSREVCDGACSKNNCDMKIWKNITKCDNI